MLSDRLETIYVKGKVTGSPAPWSRGQGPGRQGLLLPSCCGQWCEGLEQGCELGRAPSSALPCPQLAGLGEPRPPHESLFSLLCNVHRHQIHSWGEVRGVLCKLSHRVGAEVNGKVPTPGDVAMKANMLQGDAGGFDI